MNKELVKLCVDTYQNRVVQYSKNEANEVIRKAFVDLMGTDKPDYRTFRRNKDAIFEIIEEALDQSITSGFGSNNIFEQFVEYRDLNLGDTNEFYVEDKSLLSVSKFSGGHWEMRRQRLDGGASFTVSAEFYGVKIYDHFLRLLSGRIDWTAFVNKVQESVDNFLAELVYSSFMNASTYLPAEFKVTGTFSKDAFLTMCDHVQAANGGAELLIVGSKTALSKLVGSVDASFSDDMKNQKNTLGYIRYYEGLQQLVIPQVHKMNTFDFAIDNNKILVLPTSVKPIKVVREGQSVINETTDGKTNRDGSVEYMVQFKLGVATIFNVLYGYAQLA